MGGLGGRPPGRGSGPPHEAYHGPMGSLGRPLFWVTFACYAALIAWQAGNLPDEVPAHSSFDGTVDRWGTLTEHLVMGFATGVLMLLLGPGLGVVLRRLPRSTVNLPHPEYWKRDEHWPEAVRRLTGTMWAFGVLLNLFMIFVMGSVGEAALGRPVPGWLFGTALALFLAATGVWVVGLHRTMRVPAEPWQGATRR